MRSIQKQLIKCAFLCSFLIGCSGAEKPDSALDKESSNSRARDQMEVLKIESFIHSTEAVNQLNVNQIVQINTEDNPKWRINVSRKYQSSVTIAQTKNKLPLTLTFIDPGEYSITIESFLSQKDKSSGQMPNIQKHQLTFKVQ